MMENMQAVRLFAGLLVRKSSSSLAITVQEMNLLYRLAMADRQLTAGELCREMGLDKSIVSRLVERLAVKRLLERETGVQDRRRVPLAITEAGRAALNDACVYYLEPVYALRRAMGGEAFARLMADVRLANGCRRGEAGVAI